MTIHLYAEHLVNIRALSLQAALSTVSNQQTRATLSADGDTLSLEHEGESASIRLPFQVPGAHSDATLTIPAAPTKDLSFRVSLQENPESNGLLTNTAIDSENVVPWAADALTADTEIRCVHCSSVLVQRHSVAIWKNLPSENWAEMMDFWHCHRPHVPHSHDHEAPAKGYGADSTLRIQSGLGLVDPIDFVLAPENCSSLKISSIASSDHDEILRCSTCNTIVGHVHTSGGYKVRKQHLSLSSSPSHRSASYPPEKWLACLLLASIDTQGVRKFTVRSSTSDHIALKLWIFTPDINVSSSTTTASAPIRAVKIFWQDWTLASDDIGALNRQALMEGELELPPQEMDQLRDKLMQSKSMLPEPARKFQDWNVALLPRFRLDEL
ncbi:uncharacterized protein MYCFIDRAFT_129187 [Pseudocercospora fijiensis CIRAD86]|uniref:Ubiquitin-conjugating enzyme E2C-binding protein n=1 Tax=Pseudocercospora fijiensis (strain CIRAD86) TaxID=383855 RepID=N1QC82_PSEFD|nr:uncharacterized protein MYCFIDRAFT_129187 [Pseudocercospora fijiensis CIRAD86]EME88953.1 hypothetical protein MYCFIDRAFT_129187 [Pseudocercospora fijiensis CIRAD86]